MLDVSDPRDGLPHASWRLFPYVTRLGPRSMSI
jgi:hypothetical protein